MNNIVQAGLERIRLSFSEKSTYGKIIALMFLPLVFIALYILGGILSHTFTDLSIPNEYRECANVLMTEELMKGNNPYALSALNGEYPPFIYLYGPLYSLAVAGAGTLLKAVGLAPDIILLHYLMTFLFMLVSASLAFYPVWKKTGSMTLGLAAFIFLINCNWRYNYVNANPDSMGLCIMMLILFLLTVRDFKGKEILCALLTVAVFFTKQYFLLIAGTATAFFFLFKGIKCVLKYLISFGVLAAGTVALLKLTCPLFETYMLYFAKGPGTGIASTVKRGTVRMSGMEFNFQQIMSLGGIFLTFFIAEAVGCIYFLAAFIREWKKLKAEEAAGTKGLSAITEAGKNAGIDEFDLLMLIHMAVSGICLIYLGQNDGAWLSYYLELFMPALIMGALVLFKKFSMELSVKGLFGVNQRTSLLILSALFLMFIGFPISRADERLPVSPLSEEDHREWEEAEKVLNENDGDMYLYPLLGYYGIAKGIYIYNTGQPFVVSERFYKSYHRHPDKMEKYPYAENIFTSHFAFREKILDKVRKGEYSLVSYIEGTDEVFDRSDLSLKYEKAGEYKLRTGRQVWNTELWTLK
ncbi:MAG: hypothetical protein IJU87_05075 [Lachnospiraceae bacterium]|nr:hypothetical protein [Lachnospiraceae bacterium]